MDNISGNYISSSKWALPPRVKRPGREADYSPPYRAEVMNGWYYTSTSPYLPSWGAQGPLNLPVLV